MGNLTKVTQTMAADMAGVSRATIVRHIREGKLSKNSDGKIDVSELIRVYENIRTPEEIEATKKEKTTGNNSSESAQIELLKKQLQDLNTERERERQLLSNQIDDLKERLRKSEEREDRITLLLSHQTKETSEDKTRREKEREDELKALREAVTRIEENQNTRFLGFLRSRKKA